jgi:hypothetical protein
MKVCILDEGFIPGLGRGPFKTPIEISEDKYALYKRMGLQIINATKTVPIAESGVINKFPKKKTEINIPKVEEKLVEEEVKEVIPETTIEPTIAEEVVEETATEEPVVEEVKEVIPETTVEPTIAEEVVEETATEEPVVEETEEVVDLNNLTKKELIDLLTEADIKCNNTMTKSQLIELAEANL